MEVVRRNGMRLLAGAAAAAVLAACSTVRTPPPVVEGIEPPPVTPKIVLAPAEARRAVAILVSRNIARYTDVAKALEARIDAPHRTYSLDDAAPSAIARRIQANDERIVVAIGPAALNVAQGIAGVNVVYAEVTNPSVVATRLFSGVDAIPPYTLLLSHWRNVSPGVTSIGVVASDAMGSQIERLRAAAAVSGVNLVVREASNDKEALYRFRQMLPIVDGCIVLPDESTLSPTVIQQMLAHSLKQRKQVVVYSAALYALGAYMLVSPLPTDIADQLVKLIDAPAPRRPSLMPLTAMTTLVRQRAQ